MNYEIVVGGRHWHWLRDQREVERIVEDSSADLQEMVSAGGRPAHLLALVHTAIDEVSGQLRLGKNELGRGSAREHRVDRRRGPARRAAPSRQAQHHPTKQRVETALSVILDPQPRPAPPASCVPMTKLTNLRRHELSLQAGVSFP